MVLHRLAHDVRDLGVVAVVHLEHGVEHAPLHRLEAVHNMGDGAFQDYVGRVIQEPVLEHARELEAAAVAAEQTVELAGLLFAPFTFFQYFFPDFLIVEFFVLDIFVVFAHGFFTSFGMTLFFVAEFTQFPAALPPVRIHLHQ